MSADKGKSPAQIIEDLVDQVRLLRDDITNLRDNTITLEEAAAIRQQTAQAPQVMAARVDAALNGFEALVRQELQRARLDAIMKAGQETDKAIERLERRVIGTARDLSKSAGEARREAWRWFGGFWVWLLSIGSLGAVLGILATLYFVELGRAEHFGDFPRIYCGTAGGTQIRANTTGQLSRGCFIPFEE